MIHSVGKMVTPELKKECEDLAKEYKDKLVFNIATEKYGYLYQPLSSKYVKWKQDNADHTGFWKMYGTLMRSISLRETPKGYSVGVEKDILPTQSSSWYNPKKITPVWMYAWYGEKGYSTRKVGFLVRRQVPRPVFTPTTSEFKILNWSRAGRLTMAKIRKAWLGK
jgi:hypothetical protein